ncbi:hypothetical protein CE91St44_07230 [Oscillospiraceae bacterium]|nr:hypothetical protein CE91St44_07230 [Oscillospiraceae bacterium]
MNPAQEKPLKEKVSITLDGDVIEILHRLSAEDDRSLSSTINLILRKYIRENDLPIHKE